MFATGLQYLTSHLNILHILIYFVTIQTYQSHKQKGSAHCGNGYFKKETKIRDQFPSLCSVFQNA